MGKQMSKNWDLARETLDLAAIYEDLFSNFLESIETIRIKKECSNQIVNKVVSFFNNRQILSSIVLPEKNLNYW